MIIDLILDRKDGVPYVASDFYFDCLQYGGSGVEITRAMDYGEEKDVKAALKDYIKVNEYNESICNYIDSKKWLEND